MTLNDLNELFICSDCAMLHANGDTSAMTLSHTDAEIAEFVETVCVRMAGHGVAVGEEYGFSWVGCDSCGSNLGGDRHLATSFPAPLFQPKRAGTPVVCQNRTSF